MGRTSKLIGQKVGKLTVVKSIFSNGRYRFQCLCDCGREHVADGSNLRNGTVSSCGQPPCGKKRLPNGEGSFNWFYANHKRQAKKRGIDFLIDKNDFRAITSSKCAYCGADPSVSKYTRKQKNFGFYARNGIDRIDSSVGYTWNNCAPCCPSCNYKKNAITKQIAERFLQLLASGNPIQRKGDGSVLNE